MSCSSQISDFHKMYYFLISSEVYVGLVGTARELGKVGMEWRVQRLDRG
jgi:hypothetical protein